MEDEKRQDADLLELTDRLIQLRFSINSDRVGLLFKNISVADYLILSRLARQMGIHEAKVYLSDISKEMDMPINRVSSMVQNLQNKGYVYWNHDSKGTFIYLSEIGRELMGEQLKIMQEVCSNVVERIGRDELVRLLEQMNQLEAILEEEAQVLSDQVEER